MTRAVTGSDRQPYLSVFRSAAVSAALAMILAACGGGGGSSGAASNADPGAPSSGTPSSDTVAPTAAVSAPADGSTVSGAIAVSATAADNVGVTGVQFLVDGVSLGAEDASAPYAVTWNTAQVANGTHTLAARARDAAGNVTTSEAVSVTVSNAAPPPPPSGPQVTSFQLRSPQAGTRVPFTVGLAFGKGEVTGAPALQLSEQQVIVTRRWNDNSVKHAVASGLVDLAAGAPTTVNVLRTGGTTSGTPLTTADIQTAAPQASVSLGTHGTVSLAALLAAPVRTFVAGPEMIEAHYRTTVGSDATFQVWFHVRHYKTGRTWVRVSVENGALDMASSNKSYTPGVSIGGVTVFDNGGNAMTHHANTRWTIEGWIGGDPQITPRHDTAYLKAAGFVPNYHALTPGAAVLDGLYQTYAYGEDGGWTPSMGNAGYQAQIGLLPLWDALYVTSEADARAYRSVIANANALNSFRIVWPDTVTKLPVRLSDRPTWTFSGPGGGGGDPAGTGTLHWEAAHHGSGGYLAYLITGDYYHLETMMYQSAMCYLGQSSTGGSGAARFIAGQTRRMAWCLRTIGQLAGIAPPGPIVDDYRALLANQANRLNTRRLDPGINGLGYLYDYGATGVLAYGNGASSPWMQHFKIQTFGHVSDLEPLTDMTTWNAVRNHLYKAPVGILGPAGTSNYCFTKASNYTIQFSAGTSLDPTTWYDTWGEVFQATFGVPNTTCGNTLEGNSGGSPTQMGGYWGNLMPAIAYAVDDGAPGAGDAWGRLTGASNWSTLINTGADLPTWAVVPRSCGQALAVCGGGSGGGSTSGGSGSSTPPPPSGPAPAQPADTTAPTVSITAPAASATVAGTATISATASDATGVVRVAFYIDGVLKGSDTTSPYTYSWDTTNNGTHPCNGVHTHALTARAYDAADNEGLSAAVSVQMGDPPHCSAGTAPPSGSFVPPYTLPGAGQAAAIGTNDFLDVKPSELSAGSWNYSVFGSYGGGTFVEDYSAGGAWAAAGTGGHAHPDNPGGVVFDFADATWKLIRPADPDATYEGPVGYPASRTDGEPYYEITGAPGYPVPPHPYATLAPLPKALGGGSQKGSVVHVTRHAVAREARGSRAVHQFDLATGTWSRVTPALSPRGSVEADALYDAARQRYWYFTNADHNYTSLLYLDATDWTWKTTASFNGWPPSGMATGRVHLYGGLIVRLTMNGLWAIDPDNMAGGWKKLTVSGTLPPTDRNRMALWRGKFYWMPNSGGNTLHRLTPPADPWNGTWVADTVTVGGAAIPAHAAHAMGVNHYTALFRVPALDLLAWVPGNGDAVYLIHP